MIYNREDIPARRMEVSTGWYYKLLANILAKRFGIETKKSQSTPRVTTQRDMRLDVLTIHSSYT